MPIKLKCPNGKCGKVLEMPDQFAGKKGKCPACGSMFMIPNPAASRDVAVGRVVEDRPAPAPAPAPVPSPMGQPVPGHVYGDPGEPYGRPRKKKFRSRGASDPASLVMFGIGIALLVLMALTPVMPWIYMSMSATRPDGQTMSQGNWETGWNAPGGKAIFGISLGVTGLSILVLVLSLTALPREASNIVLGVGSAAAAAWGTAAAIWFIAIIWKFLTFGSELSSALDAARAMGAKASVGVYPNIGVLLGFLAAISVATLFSLAFVCYLRPEFLLIAHGIGLITGILILCLHVEPWNSGVGSKFGPGFGPSAPRRPFGF